MFLVTLARKLNQAKIPYAIVGGYALALQGIVRATMDIDLVVSLKEVHLLGAEKILNDLGLESRLPINAQEVSKFHDEYRKKRNLIAWTFVDFKDPTRQVDLLIFPPIATVKSERVTVQGVPIQVATKASLLTMKQAANRPQDQLDIVRLEELLKGAAR